MIACEDEPVYKWMYNVLNDGAGDFLKSLVETAMRADHENYRILRPVLLEMICKYPEYVTSRRQARPETL